LGIKWQNYFAGRIHFQSPNQQYANTLYNKRQQEETFNTSNNYKINLKTYPCDKESSAHVKFRTPQSQIYDHSE